MLAALKKLSDRAFENLTHDMLLAMGLRNVAWRSPGADGGRDIECMHLFLDPVGELRQELWYVECKRYAGSLGWPTIFEKIAYATSNRASVLLVVTTAKLTPACQSEAVKWMNGSSLRIQWIDGPRLVAKLESYPLLLAKYGLVSTPASYPVGFRDISDVLARLCATAEAELESAVQSIAADAAFELARLVSRRIAELESLGAFQAVRTTSSYLPAWIAASGTNDLSRWIPLMAFVRYLIRATSALQVRGLADSEYEWEAMLSGGSIKFIDEPSLRVVADWCGAHYDLKQDRLLFGAANVE